MGFTVLVYEHCHRRYCFSSAGPGTVQCRGANPVSVSSPVTVVIGGVLGTPCSVAASLVLCRTVLVLALMNQHLAIDVIGTQQQTKQIGNTAITLSDALIDADERVSRQLLCSAVDLVARNGLRPLLETARLSGLNLAYTALKAAGTNPETTPHLAVLPFT